MRDLFVSYSETLLSQVQQTVACNSMHTTEERMCRWLLMMHDRAGGEALPYTHEFLSHMLGANRKSVTLAAQSMQTAGLISYRRGTIQVLDRAGLEKASCECYAIVKERFDAFLTPPSTAVQGHNKGRSEQIEKTDFMVTLRCLCCQKPGSKKSMAVRWAIFFVLLPADRHSSVARSQRHRLCSLRDQHQPVHTRPSRDQPLAEGETIHFARRPRLASRRLHYFAESQRGDLRARWMTCPEDEIRYRFAKLSCRASKRQRDALVVGMLAEALRAALAEGRQ